jgi:hypothetical protein
VRAPGPVEDVAAAVADDAVVTHDGNILFAYAPTRPVLESAREAIEAALRADRVAAEIQASHWDDRVDEWVQVDPPLAGAAKRDAETRERDAERVESRTLVAIVGKLIRSDVERTMRDAAQTLGLTCEIHEHPHLLSTQVAFTVTGPRRKLDEFAEDLRREEILTMRAQREVMLSPL